MISRVDPLPAAQILTCGVAVQWSRSLLHRFRARALHRTLPTPAIRGAVRGHLRTEQAALKCLHLVTRSLDPTEAGRARWTMRGKPAINAFAITFGDRWPDAETC